MSYFFELSLIFLTLFSRINADKVVNLPSIKHASIDVTTLSASGLSSGGFMTTTMHYVFSSKFRSGGVFAGGPFGLGYNISSRDFLPAYALNGLAAVATRSESYLKAQATSLANQGLIDPIENLKGSTSYVYQGGADTINPSFLGLSQKVVNMYKHFGSNVKYLELLRGTHCVPTDNYGSPCSMFNLADDGLNNCGVESIFEMFLHFYGKNYTKPTRSSAPHTGTLYDFDQNAYAPSGNADTDFMNDRGGIYIPLACQNLKATCKLHVVFHGCYQTVYSNLFYDKFAVHAGYLQVADANNVIVVFPRTAAFAMKSTGTTNMACWDWFGLTTTSIVPFKQMPQVKSVTNILNAIIGRNFFD